MFKLKKERIDYKKKLGSGAYGTVYPYQKDGDDSKWVVKRIHADDSDKLLSFIPEIVLGFSCDHPCILPLLGYSIEKIGQEGYYIYLKFPRMKEALNEKFDKQGRSNKPFSEEEIVKYFYSMVCAVEYLHKKKIYHRDIKPGNMLLDENGNLMLSDVGVAKHVGEEEIYQPLTGQGGTINYTAPELLKDKSKLTKESLVAGDVWSLGLVMLELCMLKNKLFNPYATQGEIEDVQKSCYDQLKEIYSKKLLQLISQLLKLKPNERIQVTDLKQKLEDEYHVDKNRENIERANVQLEADVAHSKLSQLVENLKQENFQLQNKLKEYRSFISQLQSEFFPGLDISENEVMRRVLINYKENLNKLKESERINQSPTKIKELEKEEKKDPHVSLFQGQETGSLGQMLNRNRIQDQSVVGSEKIQTFKVVFVGDSASGKTCIVSSLVSKPFSADGLPTIGFDYSVLTLKDNRKMMKLGIYDSMGVERTKALPTSIYEGSQVVIVVYDTTQLTTYNSIPEWIELKKKFGGDSATLFIVGSMLDLLQHEWKRAVQKEEAEKLAKEHGAIYIEVSAKTGENIDELREKIASAALQNYNSTDLSTPEVEVAEKRKFPFWGLFK